MKKFFSVGLVVALVPFLQGYFGPGVTGGALAAMLGIVGSIFLALFGILYYPIKRSIKRWKK